MSKTLTEASVLKLKADPDKRLEIGDANVVGLYLVIHPTSRKVWALRTRVGGKTAKITLGPVDQSHRNDDEPVIGSPMGLRAARALASRMLHQKAKGIDIAEQALKKQADGDSFATAVRDFISDHAKPRTRTWKITAKTLGLDYPNGADDAVLRPGGLAARWGSKQLSEIDADAIHAIVVEATRKAIPGVAARTKGTSNDRGRKMAKALSRLFSWAARQRRIKVNAARDLFKPEQGPSRDRVLSEKELKAVWNACDALGFPFGPIVRLLILTAQRREEITGLKWDELSADRATLTLPGSRTKNGRTHVLTLPEAARAIINSVPQRANCAYVFSVTGYSAPSGWSKAKSRLDKLMGVTDWRIHDLRRSAISHMAALGIPPHTLEAVANHQSGFRSGVGGVYNRHGYAQQKRIALESWANHLATIIA